MNFKKFCIQNESKFKNTPRGDFIEDLKRDKEFPEHSDKEKLIEHLKLKLACDGALRAFKSLHKQYLKALLKS